MNKKSLIFISIVCLMLFTISYTYSVFSNKIVGNISATSGDWRYAFNVTDGSIENDYYKLSLSGTSGSFYVAVDASESNKNVSYLIKLDESNLSNDVKFYRDSSYTDEIINNVYSGTLDMNTSSTITIYWKSDSSVSGNLLVRSEGTIYIVAMMKNGNGYNSSMITEFWNYKQYISTISFDNDLSNLPSSCTGDSDLCWDVSYDSEQEYKVYGYLADSGSTDINGETLYNLYIVSYATILAPTNCYYMFQQFSNLKSIDFNNNFNTSNVTNMGFMFSVCSSLANLDLSSFNTSNVTRMTYMFYHCSSLTSLDLSNFNTLNVGYMNYMFSGCSSLSNLDLSSFNTSNVTNINYMFDSCSSLTTTINIMSTGVTSYNGMFGGAATKEGAQIIVNYIADASELVDNMIATKSETSNVVKGVQL